MSGTGTVTVSVLAPDRATWDAFTAALTAFKAAHPEIVSVTFQYVEHTVA